MSLAFHTKQQTDMVEEIDEVDLPKWPALTVVGDPISRQQAEEIILRTTLWYSTNDQEFQQELHRILGVDKSIVGSLFLEADHPLKPLFLEYLNNEQVCSCYVGGPHGWCQWDGTIFCDSYNIGKWPSVSAVEDEWYSIAQEFPFLKLDCWLADREHLEEDRKYLVQFKVADGKVDVFTGEEMEYPTDPRVGADFDDTEDFLAKALLTKGSSHERGISVERFERVYKRVLSTIQDEEQSTAAGTDETG